MSLPLCVDLHTLVRPSVGEVLRSLNERTQCTVAQCDEPWSLVAPPTGGGLLTILPAVLLVLAAWTFGRPRPK